MNVSYTPPVLDESLWKSWLERRKWSEERRDKQSWQILAWTSILAIAAIVSIWSLIGRYGPFLQWVPFLGSVALLLKAAGNRRFFVAALFAGVAVLHNPLFPMLAFEDGSAQRLLVTISAIPFVFALQASRRPGAVFRSSRFLTTMLVALVLWPACPAQAERLENTPDLSKYREFVLGSTPAAIASQTSTDIATVRLIHTRPALIQSLAWRPPYMGWTEKSEAAQQVAFTFYQSQLYQIAVTYDRYQTEGMTAADMTQALSTVYGKSVQPAKMAKAPREIYGEQEEIVASWEDRKYRFDLFFSPNGPSYRLIGVMKQWEKAATTAILEAERLDVLDAPKVAADHALEVEATRKEKVEKARAVNKPRFRP